MILPKISKIKKKIRCSNTNELFRNFNWTELNYQRTAIKTILMRSVLHKKTPDYLGS